MTDEALLTDAEIDKWFDFIQTCVCNTNYKDTNAKYSLAIEQLRNQAKLALDGGEAVAWRCQLLSGDAWTYFLTHPDLADDSPWETIVPLTKEEFQQEINAMCRDRKSLNAMATLLAEARRARPELAAPSNTVSPPDRLTGDTCGDKTHERSNREGNSGVGEESRRSDRGSPRNELRAGGSESRSHSAGVGANQVAELAAQKPLARDDLKQVAVPDATVAATPTAEGSPASGEVPELPEQPDSDSDNNPVGHYTWFEHYCILRSAAIALRQRCGELEDENLRIYNKYRTDEDSVAYKAMTADRDYQYQRAAALQAELDAVRKDAARYRLLRNETYVEAYYIDGAGGVDGAKRFEGSGHFLDEQLDAAIDAALAATEGEK